MKNRSYATLVDLSLDMDTNFAVAKSWAWGSQIEVKNIYTKCKMYHSIIMYKATFEGQFMEKLSNTESELKKSIAYTKEACIFLSIYIYQKRLKYNYTQLSFAKFYLISLSPGVSSLQCNNAFTTVALFLSNSCEVYSSI